MSETFAEFLHRGAKQMRTLAQAAIDAGWSGRTRIEHAYDDTPLLVSADSTHVRGIADVMNDAWASQLAALGNPTMGLLIADQWDAVADDMRDDEVVERGKAGIGILILGRLFTPRPTWTAAVAAARAFLGEEAAP